MRFPEAGGKAVLDTIGQPEIGTPLQQLASRLRASQPNPYQTSFHRFLTELVWTKDESGGGQVLQFPNHPYIKDCCDDLVTHPLQFFEKSRRVLLSWLVCAFDLWLVGGGQDPRWPALMRSRQNRVVALVALKMEGVQSSSWFLHERVKFIYEQFVMRGFREQWPDYPEINFNRFEAQASNGGRIYALPSGPDKARGTGITFGHLEEVAFWHNAKATLAAMMPSIRGAAATRGHLCIVSTAQVGSYAADIVEGKFVAKEFELAA